MKRINLKYCRIKKIEEILALLKTIKKLIFTAEDVTILKKD